MTAGLDFDPAERKAIAAEVNLSVLKRLDPSIKAVISSASHVALYELAEDVQQWRRCDVEGSLFVVERNLSHSNNASAVRHRILIHNRKSLDNYSDDIVIGNQDMEHNDQMIMYCNSKGVTVGIWFYQAEEAVAIFALLQKIVNGERVDVPQQDQNRAKRPSKRPANPAKQQQYQQQPAERAAKQPDQPGNPLERFFPALKLTDGVAGEALPASARESAVFESDAVNTMTPVRGQADRGTAFRPTAEIDEAIVQVSEPAGAVQGAVAQGSIPSRSGKRKSDRVTESVPMHQARPGESTVNSGHGTKAYSEGRRTSAVADDAKARMIERKPRADNKRKAEPYSMGDASTADSGQYSASAGSISRNATPQTTPSKATPQASKPAKRPPTADRAVPHNMPNPMFDLKTNGTQGGSPGVTSGPVRNAQNSMNAAGSNGAVPTENAGRANPVMAPNSVNANGPASHGPASPPHQAMGEARRMVENLKMQQQAHQFRALQALQMAGGEMNPAQQGGMMRPGMPAPAQGTNGPFGGVHPQMAMMMHQQQQHHMMMHMMHQQQRQMQMQGMGSGGNTVGAAGGNGGPVVSGVAVGAHPPGPPGPPGAPGVGPVGVGMPGLGGMPPVMGGPNLPGSNPNSGAMGGGVMPMAPPPGPPAPGMMPPAGAAGSPFPPGMVPAAKPDGAGETSGENTAAATGEKKRADELMRMLKVKRDANEAGLNTESKTGEGGRDMARDVAESVRTAQESGDVGTAGAGNLDRMGFRAVLQRMLTDRRLFDKVYEHYLSRGT